MTPAADTPAARLARWAARDTEIGLAAQRDELTRLVAARDREIADLHARLAHLANAAAQARVPSPLLPAARRAVVLGRLLGRVRRVAGRLRRG